MLKLNNANRRWIGLALALWESSSSPSFLSP